MENKKSPWYVRLFWFVWNNIKDAFESTLMNSEEPAVAEEKSEAQLEVEEAELQVEATPEKKSFMERMSDKWIAACNFTFAVVASPFRAFFWLVDRSVGCVLIFAVLAVLLVVALGTGFVWYPPLVILLASMWFGRIRVRRANSKIRGWLRKLETFIGGVILVIVLTVVSGGCALGFLMLFGFAWLLMKISRRFTKKAQMSSTAPEETKVEETKVEETKVEETKVEETKE